MAVIRPLIVGFATTLKHLFKKPITVNYPEQKVPMFPRYRGKQVLMRDENGLEKCVACGLCSVACPADAIYLEAAETMGRCRPPRYVGTQIHKTRCIFCGYAKRYLPGRRDLMGKDRAGGVAARTISSGTRRICCARPRSAVAQG
jgi:NADH-quinone oxidoreductase subunit I